MLKRFVLFGTVASNIQGACLSLTNGEIHLDVAVCKVADPRTDFDKNTDLSFIKDAGASDRATILNSYRGILLEGMVVSSEAKKSGPLPEKKALFGQKIKVFVTGQTCDLYQEKRVKLQLEETCCDGSGNAPCLLGTSFRGQQLAVLGAVRSGAGDAQRQRARRPSEEGIKLFKEKKFKEAAVAFEAQREKGELDARGHYLLALSYKHDEDCVHAIPVLEALSAAAVAKEVWADQEKIIRRSNLLLARCHARSRDASSAVILLEFYLTDPKKYRAELTEGIRHPDFGWVNKAKIYLDFKTKARKALANRP